MSNDFCCLIKLKKHGVTLSCQAIAAAAHTAYEICIVIVCYNIAGRCVSDMCSPLSIYYTTTTTTHNNNNNNNNNNSLLVVVLDIVVDVVFVAN